MAEPVRLGVIGTGVFGLMHLRCYKQLERAGRAVLVAAAYSGRGRNRAEMRAGVWPAALRRLPRHAAARGPGWGEHRHT